jgi:hypothetical protein
MQLRDHEDVGTQTPSKLQKIIAGMAAAKMRSSNPLAPVAGAYLGAYGDESNPVDPEAIQDSAIQADDFMPMAKGAGLLAAGTLRAPKNWARVKELLGSSNLPHQLSDSAWSDVFKRFKRQGLDPRTAGTLINGAQVADEFGGLAEDLPKLHEGMLAKLGVPKSKIPAFDPKASPEMGLGRLANTAGAYETPGAFGYEPNNLIETHPQVMLVPGVYKDMLPEDMKQFSQLAELGVLDHETRGHALDYIKNPNRTSVPEFLGEPPTAKSRLAASAQGFFRPERMAEYLNEAKNSRKLYTKLPPSIQRALQLGVKPETLASMDWSPGFDLQGNPLSRLDTLEKPYMAAFRNAVNAKGNSLAENPWLELAIRSKGHIDQFPSYERDSARVKMAVDAISRGGDINMSLMRVPQVRQAVEQYRSNAVNIPFEAKEVKVPKNLKKAAYAAGGTAAAAASMAPFLWKAAQTKLPIQPVAVSEENKKDARVDEKRNQKPADAEAEQKRMFGPESKPLRRDQAPELHRIYDLLYGKKPRKK